MHKLKSKRLIIMIVSCFVIVSMTIVCASFTQNMFVGGNAYVRASKDVRIKSISVKNASNGALENSQANYSSKSVIVDALLPNIDSTITYEVTIQNKSSDVYLISSITPTLTNSDVSNNLSDYENQVIGANETISLDITFQYSTDALPQLNTQTGSIVFLFEKPSASSIAYSSEYTSQTNLQDAIDELYDLLSE